jgi:hypothetical protein
MLRAQTRGNSAPVLNFLDFGGVGDNSTDNAAAWNALDAYILSIGTGDQEAARVNVPAGIYKMSPVTLTASYIIECAGDEGTEFRPMTSAQSHLFEFTGRVAEMTHFGILGWPTRDPADFALVGIITDGGEYTFHSYRVYNVVQGFWHKRGRRYSNERGSIGVLGEGGVGIRLGGIDNAANPLTAQSCVDNPITAQSWASTSGGIVTFTTTSAHGFAPYDYFIIYGATPSGYNGTFQAVSGTTGSTLRARLTADPGASSVLGTMTVATFVATETTRVRRARKFNIYGSSPNGYNGQWTANTGSSGNTLVACLSSNPGTSTVLGTSSSARGWGATSSETRIGPNLAVYSGASSTQLQNLLGQSWSGGVVTFTTEIEHNMSVGDRFTVRNSIPTGYNGTFTATAVDERLVSAALVTNPDLTLNPVLSQAWSVGVTTYTVTAAHNLAAGDTFTISGSVPTGYSGTFTAAAGTTGTTIVTNDITVDPGASSTLGNLIVYGEIYGRYNGTAILCDTDNGATIIENIESGSCDYFLRIADTLQLGDLTGDNYRGTGFVKLRGVTTGNCGTAGVSIEANGRSFKAFSSSFSAPGNAGASGVIINSTMASPQFTGCEWHYCRGDAIKVENAYSVAVKGSIISDIGTRGGGAPGIGLRCINGDADVYFSENTINPDLQVNTSATMDYAVLLAADDGSDVFTGTVYASSNSIRNMNIADYGNLSTSGTLVTSDDEADFVVAPSTSTAAQFEDLVSTNDVVWITEPFTTTWTETCDLSAFDGKKIVILPCDGPVITSSATPAIRVGGDNHRFEGDWWIKCSTETSVDTLCVEVAANSYRHYWDTFKPEDFGIGMQGTKGVIREIITRNFEPLNLLSYGKRFYSTAGESEIGLLRDDRIYTSITDTDADNCIMYSIGPNVGSGGLLGFEHGGGLLYGAKHALHVWATVPILTQSWAANVVTYTTEEPHGVQVGNEFKIVGSVGTGGGAAGYSGTFTAIAGTTDKTLTATLLTDPGASTTLGTFGPASLGVTKYAMTPRSIRWENFTRRAGTNTSYKFDAGADVVMLNCKSDDPGVATTATGATWSGGTATFALAADSGVRVGDYFYTAGWTPSGYNGTLRAITGTTGTSVKATIADPGGAGTGGTFSSEAHGVHLGPYFQGTFSWTGGQFHEHSNAIRNEATTAESVVIQDTLIYNSSNNDKAGVWSGYYQDPSCQNVTLANIISGTADSWRGAYATITFSGLPVAGETITFNGTVVTFRAAASSLLYEVTIGASAAATATNLVNFLNATNATAFNAISASVDSTGLIVTIVHYPGTVGNSYTLTEAATNVAVSGGGTLGGGTGTGFQKYGFEGFTSGKRGCIGINLNGNNNLSGAFSTQAPRVLPSGGGTGVINDDRQTVTISGMFPITWTVTATTSLTLPTSGTLTTTGANTFTAAQIVEVTDNSNAALRVTQLGTGNALLVDDAANPDSTPFVINNAGQVISGYTTTVAMSGGATPRYQAVSTTQLLSGFGAALWNSTVTSGPTMRLAHSRGSTIGTHSVLSNNGVMGEVIFEGSDGTGFIEGAAITAEVDGTPGTNDLPGRMLFHTTADGAATRTERARIDNKGNVVINTAAIATTATDGFLYVPSCAGTPTGTPTTYTGRIPIVVDSTNNKLYFYSGGAWRDAGP